MARRSFTVLVATDGSPQARAAVAVTTSFPWPEKTRAHGVVASRVARTAAWRPAVRTALSRSLTEEARRAERALRRRWADAEVTVVRAAPADAILAQARKRGAQAIVLGSHGVGRLRRLVLGSVSRAVVRRATGAVLVVKGRPRKARHLMIAFDDSPGSRSAVAFASRLSPGPSDRVTLFTVVEPRQSTSISRLPRSVSAALRRELAAVESRRRRSAERAVQAAARRLAQVGWSVRSEVARGVPLHKLLQAASARRADVLLVGARGVGGVERLLLGSVAEGVLAESPGSVLVVK
jgi:nucleotide-binding universal stress UspA family protein